MIDASLYSLILSARQKDQKAQTKLINMYWVDVFSFVLKKVEDQNDADEITVNVFSKVLSKLELYDPAFEFKTWVLTIAQNTIIDFWRKRRRELPTADDAQSDLHGQFAMSPEELMISEEEANSIQTIVEGMDESYRDIIRLRFFEERTIKEIAEQLNISVSNTKVRIMRAKKVLASLLKQPE